MRTAKQQDELDFLFNLKYGNNFNQGFKSSTDQDDICQALWAHFKDIDVNYIGPREPYIDSKDWTEIVHIDETINGKVLTGWTFQSNNENSNIEKIHFEFWRINNHIEKPADIIWLNSIITLPNDNYCYYGPHFHFWNKAEADRYLKFVKKLFKTGFTTKKIKSESLMSWRR
jgi:hypothetical protein